MLDDRCHGCPVVGHTELQTRLKTSFCALLLDILPSSHYSKHIPSALICLSAVSRS
jgi:hypothetical protein